MNVPDFLYFDADSELRFNGHRLRLIDVAARFNEGHSPESIALDIYPTLELPLIYKAIAFYLEHEEEVDAMLDANRREVERQAAQPTGTPTLDELRKRMNGKTESFTFLDSLKC
ncbi:MAG TPA: DUF433 domain-containing protein [Tepidisphaeraceae bacterium]|nr:DUF433 domain-containing protein [Tepidisphaeraceae bacterium]